MSTEQPIPAAWAATDEEGNVEALGMNQSRRFDTPLFTESQVQAMLTAAPNETSEYPPLVCDYCGALTPDPWHSSGMMNGKMSKHIHSCDACAALAAAPAQAVQQDAERYRWLREYAIGAYTSVFRGKSSAAVYLLTRVPALDGIGEETDTAIDAARATQEGKHD